MTKDNIWIMTKSLMIGQSLPNITYQPAYIPTERTAEIQVKRHSEGAVSPLKSNKIPSITASVHSDP